MTRCGLSFPPEDSCLCLVLTKPQPVSLHMWLLLLYLFFPPETLFVALFILCSRCCNFSSKFPPLYFFVVHSGEHFIHNEFIISVFMFSYLRNLLFICCCCSVTKLCLTLCGPVDCSSPGSPVLHHLPEFTQTHVH